MSRGIWLVLSIAFGLTAAILLASSPTAHQGGESIGCQAIIVRSEAAAGGGGPAQPAPTGAGVTEHQAQQACDRIQTRWAVLAGLAALLCLTTGSIAQLGRRERPGSDSAADSESRDPVLT